MPNTYWTVTLSPEAASGPLPSMRSTHSSCVGGEPVGTISVGAFPVVPTGERSASGMTAMAFVLVQAVVAAVLADVVVVVDAADPFFELLEEVRKTIPMTTRTITATTMTLRICLRRFLALASSARRSSLAARWRALFSLGTGRDPIRPPTACWIGRDRTLPERGGWGH